MRCSCLSSVARCLPTVFQSLAIIQQSRKREHLPPTTVETSLRKRCGACALSQSLPGFVDPNTLFHDRTEQNIDRTLLTGGVHTQIMENECFLRK
jgi:hypothetical protein